MVIRMKVLTTEQTAAQNVANESRNDALPDVQANVKARGTEEDTQGDECHVGDNVVEAKGHKREDGKPDANNLGCKVAALHTKEAGQTHEPVATNSPEEDHTEVRSDLLLGREVDDSGLERVCGEYLAI